MSSDNNDTNVNSNEDYLFYKSKYEELINLNRTQQLEIKEIKKENTKLKNSLNKELTSEEDVISYILDNSSTIMNILKNNDELFKFISQIMNNQIIKDKFLNMSDSYNFYKNNYEMLVSINQNQSEEIKLLRKVNAEISDNLKEIVKTSNDYRRIIQTQEKEIKELLSSIKDETTKTNNYLITNSELLSSINEVSLRIEKSTAHTNIKIDSRFNENFRFLENFFNELIENENNPKLDDD